MEEVMFLEVLGRHGDVVQRIELDRLPATVGRAYDNDVVLDDAYVAAHHLRIERTAAGDLRAVDLGSRNGLYTLSPTKRVTEALLTSDRRVRIGHSQLRVRPRSYDVGPEMEDVSHSWTRHPAALAGVVSAFIGIELWNYYVSSFEKFEAAKLLGPMLAIVLFSILWSGGWAIVGRLSTGRGNFPAQATITWLALTAASVAQGLSGYLAFALSAPIFVELAPVWRAAIIACALYYSLKLVTRRAPHELAFAACLVAALGVGSVWMIQHADAEERLVRLNHLEELKAPIFRLVPGRSSESFFAGAPALKERVDRLRQSD
jgi:hypothetical protein